MLIINIRKRMIRTNELKFLTGSFTYLFLSIINFQITINNNVKIKNLISIESA